MKMTKDFLTDQWENSYENQDNFIFYPKDEVVKFLNRFVRKRTGINSFKDIIPFNNPVTGLDYGCGIGRQTILMKEFGISPIGIDISQKAIDFAKELSASLGVEDLEDSFLVTDSTKIPFNDNHFDISICESVLDSMYFDVAKEIMDELARVTKKYIFFSVVSGKTGYRPLEYSIEEEVKTDHEFGTIQSYFNWEKILKLIENTGFSVKWSRLISEDGVNELYNNSRYYIIIERN